jgi:4-hydroxybenzoate polyprenyltransferase
MIRPNYLPAINLSTSTHPSTNINPDEQPRLEMDQVPAFWNSYIPKSIHPYLLLARMDRPAGTYLLYLPCTWAIAMSTYSLDSVTILEMFRMMALFGTGAFVMRGAGCTINDMWDRDLDKKVCMFIRSDVLQAFIILTRTMDVILLG